MKIEIKTVFKDFHEVDVATARRYVEYLLNEYSIPNMPMNREQKIVWIEENRLRGRKVTDLLGLGEKNANKKTPIVQLGKDGDFIAEYPSQNEASEITGIEVSLINKVLRRKNNTAGGYKWEYSKKYYSEKGVSE